MTAPSTEEVAAVLAEIAYRLRQNPDEAFRSRAFSRAAATLHRLKPDLEALNAQGRLQEIEGVGPGIAKVVRELLESGRSPYLERLREEQPDDAPVTAAVTPVLTALKGDLHAHSDWSDGRATILEMARAARARGYSYLAITDHSPRITVVNGLGPERLAGQARDIALAQQHVEGLTILRGIEVDILEDGTLDLPDETLAELDVVIASPHVKLRLEPAAMTERMLRAVSSAQVDIVGHPTGRRLGSRPGATYDFEAVFKAAASNGVAIEIDCDPARMDVSPELAKLAAACGCRLSLDSDAHAPDELAYVDSGAWMARQAGIGPELLLNCLDLPDLRALLASR